jgi:hypothetical protein
MGDGLLSDEGDDVGTLQDGGDGRVDAMGQVDQTMLS